MQPTPHDETRDETAAFETALAAEPPLEYYCLRLFVSGNTLRSARAIRNLRAICEEILKGRYDLAVIDIYQHPEQLRPEQIIVTPTLIRKLPGPVRRLIGDLSSRERLIIGLGLVAPPLEKGRGGRSGDAL